MEALKHLCRAVGSVVGNRGLAVAIGVAVVMAALVVQRVLESYFSEQLAWIWWRTWYIRDMLVYSFTCSAVWSMHAWVVSAVKGLCKFVQHGPSGNSTFCRLCRKRSKFDRLEARTEAMGIHTVRWHDDAGLQGLWRKNTSILPHPSPHHIPDPRHPGHLSWKKMMSEPRGSDEIFEYEETPPPSHHPTPAFDVTSPTADPARKKQRDGRGDCLWTPSYDESNASTQPPGSIASDHLG